MLVALNLNQLYQGVMIPESHHENPYMFYTFLEITDQEKEEV